MKSNKNEFLFCFDTTQNRLYWQSAERQRWAAIETPVSFLRGCHFYESFCFDSFSTWILAAEFQMEPRMSHRLRRLQARQQLSHRWALIGNQTTPIWRVSSRWESVRWRQRKLSTTLRMSPPRQQLIGFSRINQRTWRHRWRLNWNEIINCTGSWTMLHCLPRHLRPVMMMTCARWCLWSTRNYQWESERLLLKWHTRHLDYIEFYCNIKLDTGRHFSTGPSTARPRLCYGARPPSIWSNWRPKPSASVFPATWCMMQVKHRWSLAPPQCWPYLAPTIKWTKSLEPLNSTKQSITSLTLSDNLEISLSL